jgi:hypothetical protein
MFFHFGRALALMFSLCCALPLRASGWIEVVLPPQTEAQWVLQEARVNGVPTQVQQLHSSLSPSELLAFFKRQWIQQGGLPNEGRVQAWQTLAWQRPPLQLVLQVQPAGAQGSLALLSQANFVERRADFLPADLPVPPLSQLLQVTESLDGARRSRLVQYSSRAGFDGVQRHLESYWAQQRWRQVHTGGRGGKIGQRHWLGAYERNGQSVDIVLAEKDGAVTLVLNLMDTV